MPKIVETLRQTEWWYGQEGFPYRVVEMEESHIRNVIEWLRVRAYQLRKQHYWDEFLRYHNVDTYDVGPHAERAFHEWLRHQNVIEGEFGTTWIERQPLMQGLRAELTQRGSVDGDVVGVHYDGELEDDSDGTDGRAVAADPRLRGHPALG